MGWDKNGQWIPDPNYIDPGALPGGGYQSPRNPDYGSVPGADPNLGAPPNSDFDTETGTWHAAPSPTQTATPAPSFVSAPTPSSPSAPPPSSGVMPPVQQAPQQINRQQPSSGGTVDYYGNQFNSVLDALTKQLTQQQGYYQQQAGQFQEYMKQQQTMAAAEQQRKAAYEDQIRSQILGIMNQNQNLDINNPGNDPASRAFSTIQQRAMDKFRADQAEQRAAQGIGQNQHGEVSGALGGDIGGGQSTLAENIAGFQSRMVVDQINQRRAQLMQALQMGAGLLSQDQQIAIQREMGQLDVALKHNLGTADIGVRQYQAQGGLSLGLLQSLVGNQHFYDNLGYNIGRDTQDFNLRSMGLF